MKAKYLTVIWPLILTVIVFFVWIYSSSGLQSGQGDSGRFQEEIRVSSQRDFTALATSTANRSRNFSVAILDSGVYPHPTLLNAGVNIDSFVDYVNGFLLPYDDNGHGTASVGIMFESVSNPSCIGLFVLKVLAYDNMASFSKVYSACEWVLENADRYNIRLMNMSLSVASEKESELREILQKIAMKNVIIVTAAGNSINDSHTDVRYIPEYWESVILVGSVFHDEKGYHISPFSRRWVDPVSQPEYYAVGENVMSLATDKYYRAEEEDYQFRNEHIFVTGTSFAAAGVSGVVMGLLERDPSASFDQIKLKLIDIATVSVEGVRVVGGS